MEEAADGLWSIAFDDVLLARLDERDFQLDACTRVMDVAGLFGHRCFRLLQLKDVLPEVGSRQQVLAKHQLPARD